MSQGVSNKSSVANQLPVFVPEKGFNEPEKQNAIERMHCKRVFKLVREVESVISEKAETKRVR